MTVSSVLGQLEELLAGTAWSVWLCGQGPPWEEEEVAGAWC